MNLQIRNPRAHALAAKLAEMRRTSLTEAVISALEAELDRESSKPNLKERLEPIREALRAKAGPNRRSLTRDEIDALWGHE